METEKENKPVTSDEILPAGKMDSQLSAVQTPRRRPLRDLQTPCFNSIDASKPVVTPLQTPKQPNSHRKPRRTSLLGNSRSRVNVTQENLMSASQGIGEIKEEQVDVLVSGVLDTCINSLMKEGTENNSVLKDDKAGGKCEVQKGDLISALVDKTNKSEGTFNEQELKVADNMALDCIVEHETESQNNPNHCEERVDKNDGELVNMSVKCHDEENDAIFEECLTSHLDANCENRHDGDNHEAKSDVSGLDDIEASVEENLLADTSLYSSCHESFLDSMSEEALLHSFKETSVGSSSSTTEAASSDIAAFSAKLNPVRTPVPNFLKMVTLSERIKQAQSCLAECIFSTEQILNPSQLNHLRKQTHDVACSPIPNVSAISPLDVCDHLRQWNSGISDSVCADGFSQMTIPSFNTPENTQVADNSSFGCIDSDSGITISDSECAIVVCASSPVVLPESNVLSAVDLVSCACSPIVVPTHEATVTTDEKSVVLPESNMLSAVDLVSCACSPIVVPTHEATDEKCLIDRSMMTEPQTPPRKVASSSHSVSCSPFPIHLCDTATQNVRETQSVLCSPISVPVCDISIQNCVPVEDISIQNVVETQSVMCSPMNFPAHDISIQNNPAMQSMMCSPVAFSANNVSVQYESNMQSVMCSPINLSAHDISIQNNPAMQSMMCSPMAFPANDVSVQYEANTHSVMCSPIPISAHDVSIQNEVSTQSVLCSPMVPRPCFDKSVLAGAILVDCASGPDSCQQDETGVQAQPDMQTAATEMDESPMVNASTSMTPLKQGKKKVERFTADDVRRQHPRVLANTIDTLQIENSRLKAKVVSIEQDRTKVVRLEEKVKQLEAGRSALIMERDECRERGDHLKAETERLQHDLCEREEHWQAERQRLQLDLEVANSDHQTQINQLKEAYENQDYHDQFLSSQKLVRQMQCELDEYKQLAPDLEQTRAIQKELKTAVISSYTKIEAVGEQLLTQKTRLDIQERELAAKQAAYQADLQVLTEDQTKLENARADMVKIQTENQTKLENDRAEMVQIVAMCKENVMKLDGDLECSGTRLMEAESKVLSLQAQVDATKAEMADTEENHNKEVARFKECLKKKYMETVNLQRTLDMREADIDTLETDLFECRETVDKQVDSINEVEAREKLLKSDLVRITEENNTLKDCCAALQAKEQELRVTLDNTLEELEGTKSHATRIIKQQGSEIAECSATIGQLSRDMTSVLDQLKGKAGIQDEKAHGGTSINIQAPNASLVSQILDAVKSSASETTSPEGGSEQPCASDLVTDDDTVAVSCAEMEVSDNMNTCGISKLDSIPNLGLSVKTGDDVGELLPGDGLAGQMATVTTMFSEIEYVADMVQKVLRGSLYDLQSENYELNLRMSQCEHSERRIQAEMEYRNSELEKSEAQNKQLKEKLEEVTDRFGVMVDHEAEIKRLHEEMEGLRIKLGQKQAERDLLSSQVEQVIQRLDSVSGGQADANKVNRDLQYEVLQLQNKVERYRSQLFQQESTISDMSAKAARRMKVLEANWRKADKEVRRLDEMVDTIFDVLTRNGNAVKDEELQSLVRLINGEEQTGAVNQ